MTDDTKQARVAYLALLKEEFRRTWPHGQRRSSDWFEVDAFANASKKIEDLTKQIEEDLK